MVRWTIENGLSPIFEYVAPDNKIVVEYEKENLILTGFRNRHHGNYAQPSMMENFAGSSNVPFVNPAFDPVSDGVDFHNFLRDLKDDREGVVIRFTDGHMLKIKTEKYALVHRSKNFMNDKDVVTGIVHGTLDDIKPYLVEDDRKAVERFEVDFWNGVNDTIQKLMQSVKEIQKQFKTPKEFALAEDPPFYDQRLKGLIFTLAFKDLNDDSETLARDGIVNVLKKNVGSGPKIDQVRHLFGGHRFADRMFSSNVLDS
tara:strand:- start:1418 stop:2188 length:771 start_codon:yes stop_codon:yes gene_type:complete